MLLFFYIVSENKIDYIILIYINKIIIIYVYNVLLRKVIF